MANQVVASLVKVFQNKTGGIRSRSVSIFLNQELHPEQELKL